jgi:hypothetical protein
VGRVVRRVGVAEHLRQPVRWLGRERGEDFIALAVGEHPEVQLVVMPAEVGELPALAST